MNPTDASYLDLELCASNAASILTAFWKYMQNALLAIKGGLPPPPGGNLPSFEEIKETVGFNAYYEEEMRYSTSALEPSYPHQTSETIFILFVISCSPFYDHLDKQQLLV